MKLCQVILISLVLLINNCETLDIKQKLKDLLKNIKPSEIK